MSNIQYSFVAPGIVGAPDRSERGFVYTVVRSRTGVYHKALGNLRPDCNSRMRVSPARGEHVAKASQGMFCERCFAPAVIASLQQFATSI